MPDTQTLESTETPAGPNAGMDAVAMSNARQEEHDREVYSRLANADGPPDATPEEKPRPSATGHAPNAKDGQSQASKPASNAKAAAKPEPSADAGLERRELIEIANAVLRRDGLSDKARERLITGADDDELKQLVEHRRKVQADGDRIGNKVKELERKQPGSQAGDKPTENKSSTDGDAGGDDAAFEGLTPRQAQIVKTIEAEGDSERANEVLLAFREGAAERQPPRGQKDGKADEPAGRSGVDAEADAAAVEASLLVRLREPLDALADRFPSVKDEAARRRVIQTADRLTRAGVFDGENPTIETILEKAAGVALETESKASAQRRLMDRNATERNGQPSRAGTRTAAAPKPQSRQVLEHAAYQRLQDGESPEDVNRSLRG